MKTLGLVCICFCFFSCASLQVSETRNSQNVKSIGIDWQYAGEVDERYQPIVNDAIAEAMASFNAEKHHFTVHKKVRNEKDYLTVDFTRGKIIGKGGKAAGYIVTTVGLAAIPVLVVAESPLIFGFYYFPQNALQSTVSLSPSLSADTYRDRKAVTSTGTLFSKQKNQVPKVATKYGAGFKQILVDLDRSIGSR